MGKLRDRLLSDENIFLAAYLADSWVMNKELLDEDNFERLWALKDIFDLDSVTELMGEVKRRVEHVLDGENDFFCISVFFKPKGIKGGRTVFRPLHTAPLVDQIAMVAMLQVLVYDISSEGRLIPSELSRMLPSHFFGNRVSYDGKRLFKPWQEQYQEYTKKANDFLIEFSRTSAYRYEVNLDLENFFPSIDPRVLFHFIRKKFPLRWEESDTSTAETILRKLLIFHLDQLDEREWGWYLNAAVKKQPEGPLFAKGLPQGLPHTYFAANLFMLLIQDEYKKVFSGEMLFYVDDSVIFTNGLDGELSEKSFAEAIETLNHNIGLTEEHLRREEMTAREKLLPEGYSYQVQNFGVTVHAPGEKSVFSCIQEASDSFGELYLRGLSRETSNLAFDIATIFSDDEVEMMLSRTRAISDVIRKELERTLKEGEGNDLRRKKLLRYKKFFKYRETILQYRSEGDLQKLCEKVIESITLRHNDVDVEQFFEKYNDDILAAAIQFVLKRFQGEDDHSCMELKCAVDKLSATLYGASRKHAYIPKVYWPYWDGRLVAQDSVDPYRTLNRMMEKRYQGIREQNRENKLKRFSDLLIEDTQHLFAKFGLTTLVNWGKYVWCISDELERMVLNAVFAYLFDYAADNRFIFVKRNRRPILYSELRVLAALKNEDFSYTQFRSDYDQFVADDYQCTADYSLLQVLEIFRTFVRNAARIDQLICIHKYCCDTWRNGSKHLYFYTLHNQEHAVTLIKLAVRWLHAISVLNLKQSDFFVLFAACYLHDISMVSLPDYSKFYIGTDMTSNQILTKFEGKFCGADTVQSQKALIEAYQDIDAYFEKDIRTHHAQDSAREIRKFKELNFIDASTREFIARVSEAHGDDTLDVYCAKARGKTELINEKQIKILLRLSDLLDISRYRVSDVILKHNLLKLGSESRFHWISHLITDGCKIAAEYQPAEVSPSRVITPLNHGCIIEKLVLTVDVLMSQTTPITNRTPCSNVLESKLCGTGGGHTTVHLSCEKNAACNNKKCNFLCKWFTLKNNYLLKEFAQLKQYLNSIPEMFFQSEVEIKVRVIADRDIPNDIFDYLRDYVSGH